jgi:hypothetical protein
MHTRLRRGAVRLPTCTGTRRFAEAVAVLGARQSYLGGDVSGIPPEGIISFGIRT